MMALELDPVRLLVADDVGIGKTVEAGLIARELLDRGEIRRIAVLCPPHLAEQWQRELAEKFHIEAELVLSSTIQRLERDLPLGVSVFERHPFTVVSTDFIKAARRAEDFALKCPELVIVDEAHGCTLAGGGAPGGASCGRQQRHDLLRRLTAGPERHLVLVTATPHSGKEEAFRSHPVSTSAPPRSGASSAPPMRTWAALTNRAWLVGPSSSSFAQVRGGAHRTRIFLPDLISHEARIAISDRGKSGRRPRESPSLPGILAKAGRKRRPFQPGIPGFLPSRE